MARQRNSGSLAPAPERKKPDDEQEVSARLEQRLNDPEWRPLAKHIRKKLGDQFILDASELLYLVHGTANRPLPWPMPYEFTVPKLLAVLSRRSPRFARLLLDDVMDGRREKRRRPTAERNAIWQRWHDGDKIGPVKIAQRWWEQTHERVAPNTVKQALRRTRRSR